MCVHVCFIFHVLNESMMSLIVISAKVILPFNEVS